MDLLIRAIKNNKSATIFQRAAINSLEKLRQSKKTSLLQKIEESKAELIREFADNRKKKIDLREKISERRFYSSLIKALEDETCYMSEDVGESLNDFNG